MRYSAFAIALAGILILGCAGTADAQSRKGRLVRDGSPAQLERKARRAAALPERERIARRECTRYRGWGDQYAQCRSWYRRRG